MITFPSPEAEKAVKKGAIAAVLTKINAEFLNEKEKEAAYKYAEISLLEHRMAIATAALASVTEKQKTVRLARILKAIQRDELAFVERLILRATAASDMFQFIQENCAPIQAICDMFPAHAASERMSSYLRANFTIIRPNLNPNIPPPTFLL